MGTPKIAFPDFRMYARRSATRLLLLWSFGATFVFSLPPICRPKSQKKKVPLVAPSEWLDGKGRMIDGLSRGKQHIIQFLSGFFIHGGKNMSVGIQGDADVGMT